MRGEALIEKLSGEGYRYLARCHLQASKKKNSTVLAADIIGSAEAMNDFEEYLVGEIL